jgi:hypothetical protein
MPSSHSCSGFGSESEEPGALVGDLKNAVELVAADALLAAPISAVFARYIIATLFGM